MRQIQHSLTKHSSSRTAPGSSCCPYFSPKRQFSVTSHLTREQDSSRQTPAPHKQPLAWSSGDHPHTGLRCTRFGVFRRQRHTNKQAPRNHSTIRLTGAPLYRRPSTALVSLAVVSIYSFSLETSIRITWKPPRAAVSHETAIPGTCSTRNQQTIICICLHSFCVDLLPAFAFQLLHLKKKQFKQMCGVMAKSFFTCQKLIEGVFTWYVCMADGAWRWVSPFQMSNGGDLCVCV